MDFYPTQPSSGHSKNTDNGKVCIKSMESSSPLLTASLILSAFSVSRALYGINISVAHTHFCEH